MPNGKGTYGGYDCVFIKRLQVYIKLPGKCPICRLILHDPYKGMCCAYSFCYSCSQRVQRNNSPCPWCRKKKFEVKENKGMRHSLNQLGVYCAYGVDGCTWRGELGELQAHLDNTDHFGELLQYEYASRYTVTIYSLLGACRACLGQA